MPMFLFYRHIYIHTHHAFSQLPLPLPYFRSSRSGPRALWRVRSQRPTPSSRCDSPSPRPEASVRSLCGTALVAAVATGSLFRAVACGWWSTAVLPGATDVDTGKVFEGCVVHVFVVVCCMLPPSVSPMAKEEEEGRTSQPHWRLSEKALVVKGGRQSRKRTCRFDL